uniref:WD repeat domain phosphoinositide-interacting protein 2 n=2 Tax=Bos TaxID=9903 RepID=A0A4W2CQA9_BOBOX
MREHLGPVTCQVRPVWNGWLACGRELVVSEEQALLSGCGAACGPRLGLVNRELDLGVCPPPAPELSTGSLPLDTCSCAGTPAPVGRGTHPRGFVFSLLSADTEDVCIVERLFSSSLVAIVSLKAPRKLKVCHFKKGTEICNYSYSNTILAVKLNRQRLIVCLEESLYIHNIRDMKVLHTIRETPPNPTGLCALSINNDNCYLAYPGSATIGEVQVFDTINLRAANMIPAHDSPLAALAFDASGTKLATASEKGTVIRVFSIPEGQKLFEFRRGVKRCVSICSLAFSMDGMFLSASSNTETVHIFKLETVKEKPQEEPTTWTGYFGKVLMASTSYLPSQVTEMFNQGRAFATVRLPFCGHKNICALATIQKIPRLLVGASDGYLYMYNLDPQEGGECTLMKQHQLDGSMETTNEILDSTSHDCPLVTQAYSVAVAKGPHVPSSPTALVYTDELGAAGGSGLEEEASALRLEDDSEHPPMILRTD